MLKWFGGKKAEEKKAPVKGAVRAPARAPVAPQTVKPAAESASDANEALATYADVPKFQRLLSDGDSALFKLQAEDRKKLVAIELVGRKALIITSIDSPPAISTLESMRGALLAANYTVLPMRPAPSNVLAEIYTASGAGMDTGSSKRAGNIYMSVIHDWISYAVENRATDIHIETRGSIGQVRFRVDGDLEPMTGKGNGVYAASMVEKAMGALFNNEQQRKSGSDSLFEASKNLYCMVPYNDIPGTTLKLRYQSLKGNEGPKAILRLLHINENAKTLSFEDLGYAESHIKLWHSAMQTPSGAVLIAGITGSGKSTTQKSFIELNPSAPTSAIFTVEDPVEYPIRFAHQIPIQRDVSDPLASARSYGEVIAGLMRADPDIVMLGEIRDKPSANAMQQFAETGHMALGTVHAHLLSGIIPRLVNPEIGMNREVLTGPNMLTLLVYQALVPKLCPVCALSTEEAVTRLPEARSYIELVEKLGLDSTIFRWKRTGGCSHCNQRGTVGLTVVAEMLVPDEDWLKPVRVSNDGEAMMAYRAHSDLVFTSENMDGKTVFEHTLYKATLGLVDVRQCSRFDNFQRFVNRYRAMARR